MLDKKQWRKENTVMITTRYMKESAEFQALQKAIKVEDCATAAWIKVAIREKLERDGYLSQGKLPQGKLVK